MKIVNSWKKPIRAWKVLTTCRIVKSSSLSSNRLLQVLWVEFEPIMKNKLGEKR